MHLRRRRADSDSLLNPCPKPFVGGEIMVEGGAGGGGEGPGESGRVVGGGGRGEGGGHGGAGRENTLASDAAGTVAQSDAGSSQEGRGEGGDEGPGRQHTEAPQGGEDAAAEQTTAATPAASTAATDALLRRASSSSFSSSLQMAAPLRVLPTRDEVREDEVRARALRHEFFRDESEGGGDGGKEAEVELERLVEECKELERKMDLQAK